MSIEGSAPRLVKRQMNEMQGSQLNSSDFHSVLAAAHLVVSDSGSVCAEAALLGTPSMAFGSFVSNRFYTQELESRELLRTFEPGDEKLLLAEVRSALEDYGVLRSRHQVHLARFQEETHSLSEWYLHLIRPFLEIPENN